MSAILTAVSEKSNSKEKTCLIFEAQLGEVEEAKLLNIWIKSQLYSHSLQL